MAPQLLAEGLEFEDKVTNKYAFGNNLYEVMHRKKMRYKDLAQKIDVHQHTLSNWANGHTMPSIYRVTQIAKILGVSTDELLKGVDEE